MPHRLSVILTKAPSTDKLQFYINFSDTVWIAAASMGAVGAPEGGGRNGGWSGRCEGGGAVVVGREADEGPKENGGRAYALPPFVMRGCALLRLPDQKTMTGLRKLRLLCEYVSRKLRPNDTDHVPFETAVDDQVP